MAYSVSNKMCQLDESRREAIDGYATACARSLFLHMLRYLGSGGYLGVLFGERGCLCCVLQRDKKKILGRGYQKREGFGGGVV